MAALTVRGEKNYSTDRNVFFSPHSLHSILGPFSLCFSFFTKMNLLLLGSFFFILDNLPYVFSTLCFITQPIGDHRSRLRSRFSLVLILRTSDLPNFPTGHVQKRAILDLCSRSSTTLVSIVLFYACLQLAVLCCRSILSIVKKISDGERSLLCVLFGGVLHALCRS